MKLTFAAKTFTVRSFRSATLAGPAVLGPYRPAEGDTFRPGAAVGEAYHPGAAGGQHYHAGAAAGQTQE
jgi:hypothetical protein